MGLSLHVAVLVGTDAKLRVRVGAARAQVTTVLPYFARWVARWPDVASLASADMEELRHAWAGLGYYRRAGREGGRVCVWGGGATGGMGEELRHAWAGLGYCRRAGREGGCGGRPCYAMSLSCDGLGACHTPRHTPQHVRACVREIVRAAPLLDDTAPALGRARAGLPLKSMQRQFPRCRIRHWPCMGCATSLPQVVPAPVQE